METTRGLGHVGIRVLGLGLDFFRGMYGLGFRDQVWIFEGTRVQGHIRITAYRD